MDWKKINESIAGLYDPKQDHIQQASISDTTKPRLTLRNINNLKQLRRAKDLEKQTKSETLSKVYGGNDEGGGDMGGF